MPTATTTKTQIKSLVDVDLDRLVGQWATAATATEQKKEARDQSWLSIAQYVAEHKVTKEQLKRSLVKKGGLSEKSVGVEISRLIKFQKDKVAQKLLDQRIKGDTAITISQLRSVSAKKKGSDEVDRTDEAKLVRRLMTAVKFAQRTFAGFMEAKEFEPYLEEAVRKVAEAKVGGSNGEEASKEEQLEAA